MGRVFRTAPTEPFNILMESVSLNQLLFARVEFTAMTWERSARELRTSSFDPIIVTMMVEGWRAVIWTAGRFWNRRSPITSTI